MKANELSSYADFKSGTVRYSRLRDGGALTREEILGTAEFAGFVDGYEGHHHKYRRPRGMPDTGLLDETIETNTELMEENEEKRTLVNTIKSLFKPQIPVFHVRVTTQRYGGTQTSRRYDEQYKLGASFSKF